MLRKFFSVIFSLMLLMQGSNFAFADTNIENLNLEEKQSNSFCTQYRKKDTNSSIFLDLEGSDFKDAGSIKVSIYGRDSEGNEKNCTYRADYYILEAGKKYHLWNLSNERGYEQYNQVQLRFTCTPGQVLRGCWSPDSESNPECLRIGDTRGTVGITKDKDFDYTVSSNGECWTTIRTKANDSSVYLNLEDSHDSGPVGVCIFGIGGGQVEFENCTFNAEHFTLELGKKYKLYNNVKERGHSGVQIKFFGEAGKRIVGKWSPDYVEEVGCITISGNLEGVTVIRPIPDLSNPGAVKLNVTPISQKTNFPTGCESVSAVMLLNFYGYGTTVDYFVDNCLIKRPVSTQNADPFSAFIGDPRSSNAYGCFAPVIAKSMNKVLRNQKAEVLKGKTLFELAQEYVGKGKPVLIWATIGMRKSSPGDSWIVNYADENASKKCGESYTWPRNEHCLVLIGFNDRDFFVNDPNQNSESVAGAYEKNLLQQRFAEMGSQAVVIEQE